MRKNWLGVMVGAAVGVSFSWLTASAIEGGPRGLGVENTLSFGYDDNVSYTSTNKISSTEFRDNLTLSFDRQSEKGFLGLRYALSYQQLESKEELQNNTFWGHQVDLDFLRFVSRQLTLGVRETFYYTQRPEINNPDGTVRKPDSTYYYNTLNLNADIPLTASLLLDGSGRWQFLRYTEDDELAMREDYDIYTLGLGLKTKRLKNTTIGGEFSYETLQYDHAAEALDTPYRPELTTELVNQIPDRGADTFSLGAIVNRVFSPALTGMARAGWTFRSFNAANTSNDNAPYGDVQLTYLPAPATRLTAAMAYSLYQSGVIAYSGQTRTSASLSLAHDFTARITGSLLASYNLSEYEASKSIDLINENTVINGSETAFSMNASVAYRVGTRNWLRLGYTYGDFSSDMLDRRNYSRNRYDIAWTIRL